MDGASRRRKQPERGAGHFVDHLRFSHPWKEVAQLQLRALGKERSWLATQVPRKLEHKPPSLAPAAQ